MNINAYKEYRFINITLEAMKSGNIYEATISDENDRFYQYMKPHMISQFVEGLTSVTIDSIRINNGKDRFLNEGSFVFHANLLVTDQKDYVHLFPVCFERIQFSGEVQNIKYDGNDMIIDLCKMKIQYRTKILIGNEVE